LKLKKITLVVTSMKTDCNHPAFRVRYLGAAAAAFAVMAVLAACASPATSEPADTAQATFYPPPPDEPRLQYLTKFSTALDVSSSNRGMRRLVFGGEEFEQQAVKKPYGLAIFEGAIYVVDARGGGYVVFDLSKGRTRTVLGSGAGAMTKPINITIDTDGTRYITDTQREIILVFDRNDSYLRTLGAPGQFRPVDVAIVDDRLYVTDILHHQIQVIDKLSGDALFTFAEAGSEPGQLFHPTNLGVGPDETLYVTDTTNFRVQHFTLEGEFIREIGASGLSPGQFTRPKGVALDRDERIYVVDAAFDNVQILDFDGRPLTFFGGAGEGPGNINLPTVVKIDYDNVEYFQKYAAPGFEIEYIVLVASQFGPNKVSVFGFGAMTE
jgi:DNA-binding beta-propeller fold protein YncE